MENYFGMLHLVCAFITYRCSGLLGRGSKGDAERTEATLPARLDQPNIRALLGHRRTASERK